MGFNPEARELVPEEQLSLLLKEIELYVQQNNYHFCDKIPSELDMLNYSASLQNKAKTLRQKCRQSLFTQ